MLLCTYFLRIFVSSSIFIYFEINSFEILSSQKIEIIALFQRKKKVMEIFLNKYFKNFVKEKRIENLINSKNRCTTHHTRCIFPLSQAYNGKIHKNSLQLRIDTNFYVSCNLTSHAKGIVHRGFFFFFFYLIF